MDEFHLTRELLQAATRGEVPWEKVIQQFLNHLHSVCPCCSREFFAWRADVDGSGRRSLHPQSQRFQNVLTIAAQESARFKKAETEARRELNDLLEIPAGERLKRWHAAYKRFRKAPLAELLIEEAGRRVFADPRDALELASVAEQVARFCRSERRETAAEIYPYELEVRSLAHQANALRALGELRPALERVAVSRQLIAEAGILDHDVAGELYAFESSIRRDRREFGLAEKCLGDAIVLFQTVGNTLEVVRAKIALGLLYDVQQQPLAALEVTAAIQSELRSLGDLHLNWCGVHNLILHLCNLDRYEEARHTLEASEWLYDQFGDTWYSLRRSWIDAKIAGGLGEFDEAERSFLEVRDGFLAREGAYDAALVSLELALLYLDQGRTTEVKELAAEMLPTFQEKGIHREALAALTLFAQAVEAEQATNDLLSHVLAYLSAARNSPGLRFVHPR